MAWKLLLNIPLIRSPSVSVPPLETNVTKYETSVQALDPKPHMKGISALGSIRYNEDSSGNCNSMIVTGGYDHGLVCHQKCTI
jgi:hypothetical protein